MEKKSLRTSQGTWFEQVLVKFKKSIFYILCHLQYCSTICAGASATKEQAAKSYDKAALMMLGLHVDINYKVTDYQEELHHVRYSHQPLAAIQAILECIQKANGLTLLKHS